MSVGLQKIAPGIYRCNGYAIIKVAKDCWRITDPGFGIDFLTLSAARHWCLGTRPVGER